jgi:hypothetical protein
VTELTLGTRIGRWGILVLLIGLVAVPASGAPKGRDSLGSRAFLHMSQSVGLRYYFEHPDQAPGRLAERLAAASELATSGQAAASSSSSAGRGDVFNDDDLGLPQNEESVSVCRRNPKIVLSGTNDYRGLVDPEGNSTGWHFSNDGGASLTNEGLLPPVEIAGAQVPSGGDPVDVVDNENCDLYASSLNYDPEDPFHNANGVGLYRTDPATLASCPGGTDPACWPTRRAVATAGPGHFLDKEWFDQGKSGTRDVVWVTYSDFTVVDEAPLGFTRAEIFAVRCSADLSTCTDPIPISVDDQDVQFSDVTIAEDGSTYVTWAQIEGELEFEPQVFTFKMRVAPPGSTTFGPERVVAVEELPIPFGGFLHANDFRVATYPKNDVKTRGDESRVFVVWDACSARPLDTVCEEPVIKLTYSDDQGVSWSTPGVISAGGDNYFPAIADGAKSLGIAWFTNRYDPQFHNRQDVELVELNFSGEVTDRHRLTRPSNESEADPILGGFFIGDYIELDIEGGRAYVGYNANYRHVELLGEGFPIPQQDNYLKRVRL